MNRARAASISALTRSAGCGAVVSLAALSLVSEPAAAGSPGSALAATTASTATPASSALRYDYEYPLIGYSGAARNNPIARLQARLDRGEVRLDYGPRSGYLDSLLRALEIDASSQVLVYSKTSLQIDHINAATPRAIYFNDDSYVAWVQDSNVLELSVMDADLGAVFYTLLNEPDGAVSLSRETSRCLTCHDTYSMMGGGVPRFLIASTVVDTNGVVLAEQSSRETTDETPLQERWGGWYVSGVPDGEPHLGNLLIPTGRHLADLHGRLRGTLASLGGLFDTKPYLRDTSDVVALLVLEHQLFVKNQITRLNFKARTFLARDAEARAAPVRFATASPQTQAVIHNMCEQLLRAMLFADAATYDRPLTGSSGYDRWFQEQGPWDSRGRSLRELDLHTRLFKYPMSYVVYSEAFDALPDYVKQYLYTRLHQILSGEDHGPAFSRLSAADRAAVLEILTATKPEFARVSG